MPLVTARAEDLPTLLARIPDSDIRALFSPEFILCCEEFDQFTTGMVLRVVHSLGLAESLASGTTVGEIVSRQSYAARAAVPLEWFLRKLAAEGLLTVEGESKGGDAVFRCAGPLPPGDPDRAQDRARAINARSMPPFAVVRAMVDRVGDFLSGQMTGEDILFSPAKLPLWFDYFSNDNLLYEINNRLGAEAVWRALPKSRPSTIVELGGGSGSAALALAERLARDAALGRIGRYIFTEIVPTFLRRAERSLRSRFRELPFEFARLDIDRDFAEQGVPPGTADVVYAVNTVHIAKDLHRTLGWIREALAPGGVAVFSECVRPFSGQPIYVEFVFNFLQNFTGVATDRQTRPNHGFLTPQNWRDALRAAGFESPEILPDVEELAKHYDAFFVAAVSARRPVHSRASGPDGTNPARAFPRPL
jgi:SAM-dependent methyltransferase